MIALDEESALLMDPSFEQFCEAGYPNTVILTPVDFEEDEWALRVSHDSFVVYLPKGDRGGWEADYEMARAAVPGLVDEIVEHFDAGGSPHDHSARLTWDGAIPV
jgi:hypothetical protein